MKTINLKVLGLGLGMIMAGLLSAAPVQADTFLTYARDPQVKTVKEKPCTSAMCYFERRAAELSDQLERLSAESSDEIDIVLQHLVALCEGGEITLDSEDPSYPYDWGDDE